MVLELDDIFFPLEDILTVLQNYAKLWYSKFRVIYFSKDKALSLNCLTIHFDANF